MPRVSRRAPSSNLNVANALTALRLLLVPVFAWLLLAEGGTNPSLRIAAAAVFLIASLTDWVDGWWARKYDLVTTFGKVADPIADKALTGWHSSDCPGSGCCRGGHRGHHRPGGVRDRAPVCGHL